MRIAWFRPSPVGVLDARIATAFETELSRINAVDAFDERTAHDFVWKHFRAPYDMCLYELRDAPRYRFIGAYLFHYPGVLLIHDLAGARHALAASRLVVTNSSSAAELVSVDLPAARVRVAPQFTQPVDAPIALTTNSLTRFGVLDPSRRDIAARATARARAAGVAAAIVEQHDDDLDCMLEESDVLIALQGPPFTQPLTAALLGMSAARPVIVFDTEATADWPTLDPQTWLSRGYLGNDPPVAVSIDPRDEEHSLMLAIRRLSADAALRARLGTAARQWWETHATPRHAAEAWQQILEDAMAAPPPHADLPARLTADGSRVAREVLSEFGVSVDLFDS
jgi:hypothetical protein